MNRDQARDKIEKLLALAESDNENEAKAALLAARRLMAQFKVDEREVKCVQSKELRTVMYEEKTCSGIRNTWYGDLARVIAEHHCCCAIGRGTKGSTVQKIGFVGLGDDPDIACVIFSYAVHFVHKWSEREKVEMRIMWDRKRANEHVKNQTNSYAMGFASGLKKQYDEQDKGAENVTALVLVKPIQVEEYENGLSSYKGKIKNRPMDASTYMEGYTDGYKFKPSPQIAGH